MTRLYRAWFVSLLLGALPACGVARRSDESDLPKTSAKTRDSTEKDKPLVGLPRNEIPPDQLDAVVRAHFQGLGFMERYEYRKAANAFREVHERAPGWIPGSINLAISLLNDTGTQAEATKKGKGSGGPANFDGALEVLEEVLTREPTNLHAHYCRGLILEFLGQGRTAEAHQDFQFVAERDPGDGHAWLKAGATLTSPTNPDQPAGPDQADQLIAFYSKALDANPYLVTALYKLQQAYGWSRKRDQQVEVLARWRKLNPKTDPAGPGDTAEAFYGESGKYARVVDPFASQNVSTSGLEPPRFAPPVALRVILPAGDRWVGPEDFRGPHAVTGRARARFGATVAAFDADGDGRRDLYLAAAVIGPRGLRDALLLNRGDGSFLDVSHDWGLPDTAASLSASAGDFDADRRIDLFLTSPTGNRLLQNQGNRFEDVSARVGLDKAGSLGLTARWLDLDQDGDLDLYIVNFTELGRAADALGGAPVPGVTNSAYRNIGKPAPVSGRPQDNWAPLAVSPPDQPATAGLSIAFEPWPDPAALIGPPANYTSLAALDADDDRDLDLIVASDGSPPLAVLNDRLGRFHSVPMNEIVPGGSSPGVGQGGAGATASTSIGGLLVLDLDKDGRADLASIDSTGAIRAWRKTTDPVKVPRVIHWESWPVEPTRWRTMISADLDLDTWPDLLGLPASRDTPLAEWGRNDGRRLVRLPLGVVTGGTGSISGLALADLSGDPLPDLLVLSDEAPPSIAVNLGNGQHWLSLDLGGRWKTSFDHMRTNPHGIGTRVTLEGQGLFVTYDHTPAGIGLGQSVGPVVLGLGKSPSVELLRLRWPDGTMQCELNQPADVVVKLAETNRKTGSCPVLFTWNGDRFVCLGDFLGGGGLGYLIAPGVYGQPDRDESVAIAPEQLRAVDGVYRLSVTEPMDEVTYLDRLRLVAVDRPPGVETTPDERFAPEGPRPSGESIAWKTAIDPVRATDLRGRDVTEALRAWDRVTVNGFHRLAGWVGYTEEHGIVLDFGDRLSGFAPTDPLVLALAGWVEYPYSQTNYAASTAGVVLAPPRVERQNADGSWSVIEPHAGYPAGLPRMTTLDLTGKVNGPRCVLRLRTNMECYWDQAFMIRRDRAAETELRQTVLHPARATLGHRGYFRESSPDGREPLLYDYDHVDPAPLAFMAGRLTRYGDVRSLIREDDDRFCLVGPGDEVRLEFESGVLPALPGGWTRSFVLKAEGYCKDADPFTATSDRVDPLPWRAMPDFPFAPRQHRPADAAYDLHLKNDQTRPSGAR